MSTQPYIVFGSPCLGEEEMDAVRATLESGWIGTGPRVHRFEEEFRRYIGANAAVAVNSCTAALHLAMLSSGLEPGDEVITTPLTFAATANAIVHAGGTPVFVDVDPDSLNIDPAQIADKITDRTKVLLPVHFAGRPCDMDAITALAQQYDLRVVEDAAHAIEAKFHDRKIGTISPITCFSFYVTKNMTTAEGGMLCLDDSELVEQIRTRALHGLSADAWRRFSDDGYKHYEVAYPGFKYNMTDIQAALGLCQLRKIASWQKRREEIWQRYDAAFEGLSCRRPSPVEPDTVHARHLYTLQVDPDRARLTRDEAMAALHERGIGTGVHYRAIHLHKYYRQRYLLSPDSFPVATEVSQRIFSLPLSAKLTDEEVDRVITAVRDILSPRPALCRPATTWRKPAWQHVESTS